MFRKLTAPQKAQSDSHPSFSPEHGGVKRFVKKQENFFAVRG
jgi:hypothetical protein